RGRVAVRQRCHEPGLPAPIIALHLLRSPAARRLGQTALSHPSSPSAHGTALPRLKISSSDSSPGQTPILSLSGYTETAGTRELENINVLAGDVARFISLCAPAGPGGKQTRSPRSTVCSPSGVRTTIVPSTTSSHSS